jgi:hypothetical protein
MDHTTDAQMSALPSKGKRKQPERFDHMWLCAHGTESRHHIICDVTTVCCVRGAVQHATTKTLLKTVHKQQVHKLKQYMSD